MSDRWRFLFNRIRERLWVKPLLVCILSIVAVFVARMADGTSLGRLVPHITIDSIEALLKIVAASMLVIATFAVASMVSAYASASSSATPRTFPLVIADDMSQNALSTFIGAFIFSVVALVALLNGYYGQAGRFAIFLFTVFVFGLVIVAFVRWVDSIARLGRLSTTIDKVEAAAEAAIKQRQVAPLLGGIIAQRAPDESRAIYGDSIGYLRHIDVAALQRLAEESQLRVTIAALPGAFCTPDRPVAHVTCDPPHELSDDDRQAVARAFEIGDVRAFDQDPRFGLVVLSEIASRALSPAVNDPGTAIDVIGTLVRLFVQWGKCGQQTAEGEIRFDRIAVPKLALADMFDDAFTGISRDGAATVEVAVRLQKAFNVLSAIGDSSMRENAERHARLALLRSEHAMQIPDDIESVRTASAFDLESR